MVMVDATSSGHPGTEHCFLPFRQCNMTFPRDEMVHALRRWHDVLVLTDLGGPDNKRAWKRRLHKNRWKISFEHDGCEGSTNSCKVGFGN